MRQRPCHNGAAPYPLVSSPLTARHGTQSRRGTARARHFACIGGTEQGTARHAGAARERGTARYAVAIWEPSTARRGAPDEWTPPSGAALALIFQVKRLKMRGGGSHAEPTERAKGTAHRRAPRHRRLRAARPQGVATRREPRPARDALATCPPRPMRAPAATRPGWAAGRGRGHPAPGRERSASAVPGRDLRPGLAFI